MAAVRGAEDLDAQLKLLTGWLTVGPSGPTWQQACLEHGESGYGPVESDVLYAFVRRERPKRIVQIGAGVSTAVMLRAAADAGYTPKIICVDPFPTGYLLEREAQGDIRLVAEPAEQLDPKVFLSIDEGDLLFVDSTHTVKPGSEVNRIILDILPRLSRGVWVHFHDILFPFDYSRGLLTDDLFFWGESTLLFAFLSGNAHFAVRVSMSMLHYGRPEELRAILPWYVPQDNDAGLSRSSEGHFPSSTFLQAVSDHVDVG